MRVLWAAWIIMQKDLRIYFRDRTGMLLGFLLPIALITVFGFIMKFAFGGGGGMPQATLWVADEDGSQQSRRLVEMLRGGEMLRLRPRKDQPAANAAKVRKLVRDGEAHHALIIEAGYGKALEAGELPKLTMVRDPGRIQEDRVIQIALVETFMAASQGKLWPAALGNMMREWGVEEKQVTRLVTAARTVNRLVSQFLADAAEKHSPDATLSDQSNADRPHAAGPRDKLSGQGDRLPFDVSRVIENMLPINNEDIEPPDRPRNLTYTLAQAVAGTTVMMLMFGLMACSNLLLLERESGTLRRLLAAAMPRAGVFWGKYLFCVLIGLIQLLVLFTFGNILFRVGAFRDPVTLLVLSLTWAVAATSFGMLVAAWARTAKQAEGLATLLILVMAALGGCWFPVQLMSLPRTLEIATQCTLTYWAMTGYQGMFWEQWSWTHPRMLAAIGIQWGFAAAASVVAVRFYYRRYVAG